MDTRTQAHRTGGRSARGRLSSVAMAMRLLKAFSEDEESEIGMRCIAAPVRNDMGEVIAAIGVGGPVSRLTRKTMAAFVPHVIGTAGAISGRLGYRGST